MCRFQCTSSRQMHSRWLAANQTPDELESKNTRCAITSQVIDIELIQHNLSIQRVLASSSDAKCRHLVLTMMCLFDLQWNDIDALSDIVNDRYVTGVVGYSPQWLRTLLNDSDCTVWNVTKHSPVAISVMQQKHAISIDLLYRENNDTREPTEVRFCVCN